MNYLLKINCNLIDKARLFKGAKGLYLDLVMRETPNGQYDQTHMVCQSVTKEERLAGKKGAILGNAKPMGGAKRTEAAPASQPASTTDVPQSTDNDSQNIPF